MFAQLATSIHPLIIDPKDSEGTGLLNPSILVDGDRILVNLRRVQYTLYHSEKKNMPHPWGPLCYLHPENDVRLRTTNYLCEIDPKTLEISKYDRVDTSKLDVTPLWEFVGLEDARLFKADDKIYLCGVRRDTTTNGEGRMELSELQIDGLGVREISRTRIPAPPPNNSYCEKNWMPIKGLPYHFMKWTNSSEIVKFNPESNNTEVVHLDSLRTDLKDMRGGSQVIPWKDGWIALVHDVDLYFNDINQKDATYRHHFVVWDKNWKLVQVSEAFSFLTGEIEFCAGMDRLGDDLLITFGFQDNAAYLLNIPVATVEQYILDNPVKTNPTFLPTDHLIMKMNYA